MVGLSMPGLLTIGSAASQRDFGAIGAIILAAVLLAVLLWLVAGLTTEPRVLVARRVFDCHLYCLANRRGRVLAGRSKNLRLPGRRD